MHDVLKTLIAAAVSFLVLFLFSKLLGKKQISQLDFVDYVVGISIGSIAAEMSFDTDKPLYIFIISMGVYFVLAWFVSFISRKGVLLKKIMKGRPFVLIYEGKLNYKNLKKSKLDVNDLLCLCREKDYFDLSQIYYAVLETNGMLTIVPVGEQRPAVAGDLPIELQQPSLPNYLVVDGNISYSGLNELQKDEQWLYGQLNVKDKVGLKNVILAMWDDKTQKLIAHYKCENGEQSGGG